MDIFNHQLTINQAISTVLLPSIYEDIGLDGNNDGDIKGGRITGTKTVTQSRLMVEDIFASLDP